MSGPRTARLAAVTAAACVLGPLSGPGSAARDQREARLTAAYACSLASGTQSIEVTLDAEFPERGAVGKPIRPVGVTVRASLPRAVVARLLPEGAKSVSGTATLATAVAQGRERVRAEWADLTAGAVALPAEGAVEFGFSGDVPHVTVGSAGEVSFSAGRLDLTIAAESSTDTDADADADTGRGTSTGTGTDADTDTEAAIGTAPPASTALTCTPDRDADLLLATVPVEAPTTETPDVPSVGPTKPAPRTPNGPDPNGIDAGPRSRAATDECPADPPKGRLDPERLPPVPPGGEVTEGEPTSACAVPVGFATMRKLKGSAIVNDPRNPRVGLMRLAMLMRHVSAPEYNEYDHLGIMQLPDVKGTFLAFGFQPITAKVRFEARPATVVNIIRPGKPPVTRVGYRQHLRLHGVRVNGVPLDVGPRCRTSRPIDTRLTGSYPVTSGGLLQGTLDIPPFSGCGANGEDLDPLLTATVSGPGNPLKIRQGPLCTGSSCKAPPLPEL
ncbi:DUF6801 domain-containing protein [Streptomyces sp. NPDC003006]